MTVAPIKPLAINARQGNILKMEGGRFMPAINDKAEGFKEEVLGNLRRAIRQQTADLISKPELIQVVAGMLGVYEGVAKSMAMGGPAPMPAEPATTEPETPAT